jgi:hypothetical protein
VTSGSYYPPPVRTVFIPKKPDGLRPLSIPTVSDRIAQGEVKNYLEPMFEAIFHNSLFGYSKAEVHTMHETNVAIIAKPMHDVDIKASSTTSAMRNS